MSRRTRVWYALSAAMVVACLGLSIARADLQASLAWFVALGWLTTALLNHRDATTARDEVARLRTWLTYTREDRDAAYRRLDTLRRARTEARVSTTSHRGNQ